MPKITVDNREVEAAEGATILEAARAVGIDIPTLCHWDGREPSPSCMVCVVKMADTGRLVPSCGTKARDGMRVESATEEVADARRAAIELLLNDHVGDCVAPCQAACPLHADIPLMIRSIAAGDLGAATAAVRDAVALPTVLGRVCPAPCEKACRRREHDEAVSIRLLERLAAAGASGGPRVPAMRPATGRRVGVVGAGPAGLAAAWRLLRDGHAVALFDDHEEPGGALRRAAPEPDLPIDALEADVGVIMAMGAVFRGGTSVGRGVPLDNLRRDFDAVVVAVGELGEDEAARLGLPISSGRIEADATTCDTGLPGVYAAGPLAAGPGGAARLARTALRAVADGTACAVRVGQHLAGLPVTGPARPFSMHMGRLLEGEIELLVAGASDAGRVRPSGGERAGLAAAEAREEARRCLHCDCRKRTSCLLRRHAKALGSFQADPRRYGRRERAFTQDLTHPDVVYEPGKCIACGRCIEIARAAGEPDGLAFVGRGLDVRVGVPFGGTLAEGLTKAAAECVEGCPTGALAFR